MLADCIRLAQTNNEALEALLQKFAPLIKKCGRQLHIEDGNEEMILAFIELVKDFSPSNLRNIDDGTVVRVFGNEMNCMVHESVVRGVEIFHKGSVIFVLNNEDSNWDKKHWTYLPSPVPY